MDQFEKLPDELVIRMFENHVDKNFSGNTKEIRSLRATCKRFYHIINYKLLTPCDYWQYPVLYIEIPEDNWKITKACRGTDETCSCYKIRRLANIKFKIYRKLQLTKVNLRRKCFLDFLERTDMSPLVELSLVDCWFDLDSLNRILTAQPNIKRLSFYLERGKILDKSRKQLKSMEPASHKLVYLYLDLERKFLKENGDILLEYILNYLPASELEIRFDSSNKEHLEWARKYLSQHQETIKHFLFRVGSLDKEVLDVFDGYDYDALGPKGFHPKFIIISPGHPRKPPLPSYTAPVVKPTVFKYSINDNSAF